MTKLIFKNSYTRDTTVLIQQIWAQQLAKGVQERKGWSNPYLPFIVHYMINGTIEIWDNEKAVAWFQEKLLEQNLKDQSSIKQALAEYKEQLTKIKAYWAKGKAETQAEFEDFVALMPKLLFDFNQWYYTVTNEKSPQNLIDEILAIRKDDTFFASTDIYLGNSLKHLYPEIAGYENLVLAEEITNIPSLEVLKKRAEGAALIDGEVIFLGNHDAFAAQYPDYILDGEKAEQNATSVKGQVAFKASIKGTVRILRRREQVGEVQQGDIIVSPMTTPDFLPAMEKAAAFVTDEGGITCHAAIVAREMKKACVIGTKVATKVFKDGDIVEINGETGVVSVIK